ncbi:MAG: hypothetical protein EXS31_16065 [Pedosphaera sp.]|nr:hypothetical protein [Pedosphaera sp.]
MPEPADKLNSSGRTARELYAALFRQGTPVDSPLVEQLCLAHPSLASELRELHAFLQLARTAASSPVIHESVRELFGEEAQVTLTLDEAGAASEDEKATIVAASGVPPSGGPGGELAGAGISNRGDRYSLEGEVARGGMGIIYKVRDRELNRTLAMKVMLNEPAATSLAHRKGEGHAALPLN